MNWNMAKLGFATACAMALAVTPALAYGPNGNWNGSEGQSGYQNNQDGYNGGQHGYQNRDNGYRNGQYGYNQYNQYEPNQGRYNRSGYNNENRYENGRNSDNGRYGYNQYNRDGYARGADDNQYGYNGYRQGGGAIHYSWRPSGPQYWEYGHNCYSISCEQ